MEQNDILKKLLQSIETPTTINQGYGELVKRILEFHESKDLLLWEREDYIRLRVLQDYLKLNKVGDFPEMVKKFILETERNTNPSVEVQTSTHYKSVNEK